MCVAGVKRQVDARYWYVSVSVVSGTIFSVPLATIVGFRRLEKKKKRDVL
jgi:hypothetical protein